MAPHALFNITLSPPLLTTINATLGHHTPVAINPLNGSSPVTTNPIHARGDDVGQSTKSATASYVILSLCFLTMAISTPLLVAYLSDCWPFHRRANNGNNAASGDVEAGSSRYNSNPDFGIPDAHVARPSSRGRHPRTPQFHRSASLENTIDGPLSLPAPALAHAANFDNIPLSPLPAALQQAHLADGRASPLPAAQPSRARGPSAILAAAERVAQRSE